jgi:glycosyltransferase involved in cell wall biosynthesis
MEIHRVNPMTDRGATDTPRLPSSTKVLMISFTSLIQELYHGLPRELAKLPGVELSVLVSPYWKELWSTRKRFLELPRSPAYAIEVGSILFAGNLHFAVFRNKIGRLLRQLQPDIIDLEDEPFNAGSAQVVYLTKRLSPRSRIVLHASQSVFKRYPPPFGGIERYVLRNVDAILARNEDAKNVLLRKGFDGEVAVVTHGVDPELFERPRAEARASLGITDEFVVGYAGAIVEQKGLSTLLRAVKDLSCTLLFVGDGEYKQVLMEHARAMGIEHRVRWIPAVSHGLIPAYLAAMDVFVLPSRTWPNWREKFGRVLIEAMAAGTPVIGSDSGEIPKVIGGAGLIFREGDEKELRTRIRSLMENATARSECTRKGKERVKTQYSWQVIARQTHEVYTSILRRK